MTTPKKSSFSNCRGKELSKMTDLSKLYKKVERISKRIFHGEKNQSTFVPSAQQHQQSSAQSTSSSSNDPQMPHQPVMINPPYPVHPGFGTGFPQFPYPVQQQQPQYPPSYGWALNSAAAAAASDSSSSQASAPAFGALSLDVGVGNESAGSGFDHLAVHHDDEHNEPNYLRPNEQQIIELRKAQSTKLEKVKQQVMDEVGSLNYIFNDVTELDKYYDAKYPYILVQDDYVSTEELEEEVRKLEEKLRRLRAKSPNGTGLPPPRPPPPRSVSQESSTGPWTCARCLTENRFNVYRCKKCNLPSRRFDPSEIEFCGCEYCSTGHSR
ncbi:hypothetical protein CAEBREN_14841 [Caenorhabditis brenneri]|uniref:RanBP2-type domain-containing protein n=1 Tax=Caenorhabditis brenneri TaxID=135651 RepID=G0MNU4_CAEBE|nr:hypothetical protein CAEBREN_14841 [Caenorhabditis brenneri]